MGVYDVLGIFSLLLVYGLYNTHKSIHHDNPCGMTFMWRAISFYPVLSDSSDTGYSLLRYFEGPFYDLNPTPQDVPVLFIPGSAGSFQQVRSVASVMMNKTIMNKYPYKFQFYTIDFKEQHAILSGNILFQQRKFVKDAVAYLRETYSKSEYKKVVIIGHSFGGVLAYSLPAEPGMDVSSLDFIITLAAPLHSSPVFIDRHLTKFYKDMHSAWKKRKEELYHIGLLSYSGGEKDFLVPDHLTDMKKISHIPSWSIDFVNTPVDHLCILWCNQLIRHATRSLAYYMDSVRSHNGKTAREIVTEFRDKELKIYPQLMDEDKTLTPEPITDFMERFLLFNSTRTMAKAQSSILFDLKTQFILDINVELGKNCGPQTTSSIIYPNGLHRNLLKISNSTYQTWMYSKEGRADTGLFTINNQEGCEYHVSITVDVLRTWYIITLENLNFISSGLIYFTSAIVLLGSLNFSNKIQVTNRHGFFVYLAEVGLGIFVLYCNKFVEHYVIVTSILTLFVLGRILCHLAFCLILRLPGILVNIYRKGFFGLSCILAFFNPYLANVCLCLSSVLTTQKSHGLDELCLSLLCAAVHGAIGVSAVYRKKTLESFLDLPVIPLLNESVTRSLPVFIVILFKSPVGVRISSSLCKKFNSRIIKIPLAVVILSHVFVSAVSSTRNLDDAAFTGSLLLCFVTYVHTYFKQTV